MSMITELVERLRKNSASLEITFSTAKNLREAADVIEELSAKLQAANMERSSQYYNGGWIPISERLPKPNRLVLCYITTGATETYFLALWNDTLNAWEEGIGGYRLLENDLGYKVVAWMPLPEPYKAESEVN